MEAVKVGEPMVRNTPKSKRTRQRIIEVALPLFGDLGYAGASIRRIASAADVNVATGAYHFTDKQGLYDTVIGSLFQELSDGLAEASLVQMSGLRDAMTWGWRFACAHKDHIRILTRHYLDHQHRPQQVISQWAEPLLARAVALIRVLRPEWSVAHCRLFIISFQYLVARYAIEDLDELRLLLGEVDDIEETIVTYLETSLVIELGISVP